ncbi:MAG: hypothetical protein GY760_27685 [Deltaproteobacteria bacterium]|nr:hypothetical protein [Deltaproteobacteria bacterium]
MALFKGSQKRLEILSKLVLLIVTCVLSFFLISLGGRVLYDIDHWSVAPVMKDFRSVEALNKSNLEEEKINKKLAKIDVQIERSSIFRNRARRRYSSEKRSFNNWIRARKTIGSSTEDEVIRKRASKLDKIKGVEDRWQDKINALKGKRNRIKKTKNSVYYLRNEIKNQDRSKYSEAYKKFKVKVFIYRLLFVLPILILAIIAFIKLRKSKLKSLVWAYIIFALYSFFWGLLPYMPNYGGYIRYSVGILLTILIGIFVIKRLKDYTEKKKLELEQSMDERVKSVKEDVAVKSYKAHCCPSCEKDFLMNNWQPKTKLIKEILEDEAPDFCQHCGLTLFNKCEKCGNRKFAHFPFCSSCGARESL